MKTFTNKGLWLPVAALGTGLVLFSCSANDREAYPGERYAPARLADSISGAIAKKAPALLVSDTAHAFIRTASIRFEVANVQKSTGVIEDIVNAHGGYVTYTNLSSHVNSKSAIRLSKDSMIDVIRYETQNSMTLRIPNEELDTTLKAIEQQMAFLDRRNITAKDVKLELLANRLSEARFHKHEQRVEKAIASQGKKLLQTNEVENELLIKQSVADDSRLSTLELLDQVDFSTVNLDLYQRETQRTERYAYMAPIEPYEPGFGSKLASAASAGGRVLGHFLLFLVAIWPLLLIGVGVYFLVRWLVRRSTKVA